MDDTIARRNVMVLVAAQTLFGAQMPILIIFAGLAGALLAEDKSLATLPISIMMLCTMLASAPVSLFMGKFGRRNGFLMGVSLGAIGGGLGALALFQGSFLLLLLGAVFSGIYQSCHALFRFAAADTASDDFKPRAISWVLAGGLGAALLGPELGSRLHDIFPETPFAGAYLVIMALNIIFAPLLFLLRIPLPVAKDTSVDNVSLRPVWEILRESKVMIAIICAMVSYALMSLVMTATPLAMHHHGFSTETAADVVRWHVIAMFAPSFFTGELIRRFGASTIIGIGLILLAVCGVIALSGVVLFNFYTALILLGIGWNFGFIGATTMLTSAVEPQDRPRIQGINDFFVFGLVTIASFSSGSLLDAYGWDAVQYAMPPFLLLATVGLLWLALSKKRSGNGEKAQVSGS